MPNKTFISNQEIAERLETIKSLFNEAENKLENLMSDVEKNEGKFNFGGFRSNIDFSSELLKMKISLSPLRDKIISWINKSF